MFRSPQAIRIAGIAAVLATGIGIGSWLGNGNQHQTPSSAAFAPSARYDSPPGELRLRMDLDFERIQSPRR